jgi:colanic acid/amylovoran biosynthesis protein
MSSSNERIVIAHAYSYLNKGDAGIIMGMIRDIRDQFSGCEITLVSQTPDIDSERYDSVTAIESPYRQVYDAEQVLAKVYYLLLGFVTVLWGGLYRITSGRIPCPGAFEIVHLYAESSAVLLAGGDKFYDYDDGIRRAIEGLPMVLEGVLAIVVSRPLMVYAHSGGPFQNRYRREFIKRLFQWSDLVTAREPISKEYFDDFTPSVLTADAAFLAPDGDAKEATKTLEKWNVDTDQPIVGMTVREWNFPESDDPERAMDRYRSEIIDLIDNLSTQGFQIVFVPQVIGVHTDDRQISELIASQTTAISLNGDYDVPHLRELIDNCDFFIGTRMHSNIFALSKHVPVAAIAYRHKTRGIMRMVGLERYVVDIDDVNGELRQTAMELIDNGDDIRDQLRTSVPDVQESAKENGDLLRQII